MSWLWTRRRPLQGSGRNSGEEPDSVRGRRMAGTAKEREDRTRCASTRSWCASLPQLLDDNGLTEIEVEDGERRIKVAREPAAVIGAARRAARRRTGAVALRRCTARGHRRRPQKKSAGQRSSRRWSAPPSSRPSPAPRRSSTVGDTVKAGDTLLIVEAMKVMNPITAPEAGVGQEDHGRRCPAGRVRPAARRHRLRLDGEDRRSC